jgi:hypothetical protein
MVIICVISPRFCEAQVESKKNRQKKKKKKIRIRRRLGGGRVERKRERK